MVKVSDVLQAYAQRDALASKEQELEDVIFNVSEPGRDAISAETLGREYRRIKDKRSETSVKAAVLYMQLDPESKAKVTEDWKQSKEGQRKSEGSGIRGTKSDGEEIS